MDDDHQLHPHSLQARKNRSLFSPTFRLRTNSGTHRRHQEDPPDDNNDNNFLPDVQRLQARRQRTERRYPGAIRVGGRGDQQGVFESYDDEHDGNENAAAVLMGYRVDDDDNVGNEIMDGLRLETAGLRMETDGLRRELDAERQRRRDLQRIQDNAIQAQSIRVINNVNDPTATSNNNNNNTQNEEEQDANHQTDKKQHSDVVDNNDREHNNGCQKLQVLICLSFFAVIVVVVVVSAVSVLMAIGEPPPPIDFSTASATANKTDIISNGTKLGTNLTT